MSLPYFAIIARVASATWSHSSRVNTSGGEEDEVVRNASDDHPGLVGKPVVELSASGSSAPCRPCR